MGIPAPSSIDARSGYCSATGIFHSIRPLVPLPAGNLSVADYVLYLIKPELKLKTEVAEKGGVLDAGTGKFVAYSEIVRKAETLAEILRLEFGLKRGDVAFVVIGNLVEIVVVLYLALLKIGVVVSPANPVSTGSEIDWQVELCKPVIAFATSLSCGKIRKLRFGTVLVDSVNFESMMETGVGVRGGSGNVDFGEVGVMQDDPAMILYSSGTTGRVKGVVLSHRNLIAVLAGSKALRQERVNPAVMFCTVPYFHVYGLVLLLRTVAFGESLMSMERVDAKVVMRAIGSYGVTHLAVAPPLVLNLVREREARRGEGLGSLEVVFSGGAPLREDLIKKFQLLFPNVQLSQAYGLTETTGGISRVIGLEESKVLGANGRLIPNGEAKVVDPETGEALPPKKVGEIWFRGPTVMKGYLDDEDATAGTVDPDGWLKTGDLGYFDDDGFLFFTDRIKELIKYNAYQVAPAELEHVLQSHPEIVEAAVIPYPDEEAGQVPMAYIVRKFDTKISESQVMKFVADQVAPYKRVRRVSFVNSIPKTATGKVLRKELIKMALSPTMSKL